MTAVAIPAFAPREDSDRNFFLLVLGAIWAGILAGFIPDALDHFTGKHVPYQWIVHVHAATYVGWLALLTTQMVLIRSGAVAIHRRLGVLGLVMIPIMLIVGPWAFVVMGNLEFGTPDGDAPFLILPVLAAASFAIIASAALLLRRDAAAHKRLMLIATIVLADAGWARWLGPKLTPFLTKIGASSFITFHVPSFVGSEVVMASILIYDLATRRRLHPAVTAAVVFAVLIQVITTYVYLTPAWKPIATHLLGH